MSIVQKKSQAGAEFTPARQSSILSQFQFQHGTAVLRVPVLHSTIAFLKWAGVPNPRPLDAYAIPVCRDESGWLVLDRTVPVCPISTEYPEPGAEVPRAVMPDLAPLAEVTAARMFQVTLGGRHKVRLTVVAYEDDSLPIPEEPEHWVPTVCGNADLAAAMSCVVLDITSSPNSRKFEIL